MNTGHKMLSDSKFYSGYSRWDDAKGGYESWNESVERVMNMHREKYKEKMTPELNELFNFAEQAYKDKLVLGAQRALQFGGEQLFKHEARCYNCFSDTTQFVTSDGVHSFRDYSDGDVVRVLTHTGQWKPATVRSYGIQSLNRVTFSRQKAKFEVLVTSDHRWLKKDGSETTSLSEGDGILKPQNTFSEFDYETSTVSERLYWCYGMVYGDGTKVKNKDGVYVSSKIRLCGTDKQFAHRFEEMGFHTSTSDSLNGDFHAYTGSYLKTAPNPEVDSPELIRAFVAGYLQADGAKSGNDHGSKFLSIQSSELDHIEFIRKCFPIAGVWITSERELTGQETNFGIRPYTILFGLNDNVGSKYNTGWYVSSIKENVKSEIVWCLEVEDDASFIFPNGIVTGNCSVSHTDRPAFFNEAMYLMLCGVGVGFSVQRHHIAKLPKIARRSVKKAKIYQVPDSIEGWADAFGVLLSSYFIEGATHPEFRGTQVHFDFSKIRPKGAVISGGFKAPGPDGLRAALIKCESVLEKMLEDEPIASIDSIGAYDFVMHMSDAVLSGGVRRSATICVFDKDDEAMLKAKTGDWFIENPQRGRSNNSAMLVRDELTRDEWANIMKSVRDYGEPGFIFSDNKEFLFNPCVEVGMLPVTEDGESGFQFCNLTEINGGECSNREKFLKACKAAAILGTIQAGYTNFKYVSDATRRITEREALIGVSITGWMNNPAILFDKENMIAGSDVVKEINKQVAKMLGINQAARCTNAKPSGNASVILGTASGIHGEHSPMYFRHVQMNEDEEVAQLIKRINPHMVEKSVWSAGGTDVVIAFPVKTQNSSKYKKDLMGVRQLEYVKMAQQYWVENGTNVELCVDPKLRHNISNTISVDNWDEVEQYIFDNRQFFAGISLLSAHGDKAYVQAPFAEVFEAKQILKEYGGGSLFASGLIVEALRAYDENLWIACDTVMGTGMKLDDESASTLLKRDWVRRAKKFAENYFEGDLLRMTFCLKDCYNLHKWNNINRDMVDIDFTSELQNKSYIDADNMLAAGCSGNSCEISF